ncbi:unnamed protein product, partial [Meganyctiphanes norvegica]
QWFTPVEDTHLIASDVNNCSPMYGMCSENYIKIGDECFMFSDGMADWAMAQNACKSQGDILAVPSDMQSFLGYIKIQDYPYVQYFIGGSRDTVGKWTWQGGNEGRISDEYWETGHAYPDLVFTDSMCTTVILEKYGLQKWLCSNTLNYICQQAVNEEEPPPYECYTIPILATLIILLLFLIIGLSVYVYIERQHLNKSLSSEKPSSLPAKSIVRHDSENSLYGHLL